MLRLVRDIRRALEKPSDYVEKLTDRPLIMHSSLRYVLTLLLDNPAILRVIPECDSGSETFLL